MIPLLPIRNLKRGRGPNTLPSSRGLHSLLMVPLLGTHTNTHTFTHIHSFVRDMTHSYTCGGLCSFMMVLVLVSVRGMTD